MEPVHGGRDDPAVDAQTQHHGVAAMEPVHGGRDDVVRQPRLLGDRGAAMEPVHGGRDDPTGVARAVAYPAPPQWSPSTEDGTTSTGAAAQA